MGAVYWAVIIRSGLVALIGLVSALSEEDHLHDRQRRVVNGVWGLLTLVVIWGLTH